MNSRNASGDLSLADLWRNSVVKGLLLIMLGGVGLLKIPVLSDAAIALLIPVGIYWVFIGYGSTGADCAGVVGFVVGGCVGVCYFLSYVASDWDSCRHVGSWIALVCGSCFLIGSLKDAYDQRKKTREAAQQTVFLSAEQNELLERLDRFARLLRQRTYSDAKQRELLLAMAASAVLSGKPGEAELCCTALDRMNW